MATKAKASVVMSMTRTCARVNRDRFACLLSTIILLLVSLTSTGIAQQSSKLEDPPWIKEVAAPRILYTLPGMEKIAAQKDLTYKRVAADELKMDVYSLANRSRRVRRPVVLFIHGGAVPPNLRTKPKEWGAYVSFGQLAAASGFVGVTFNHRFYGWDKKSLTEAQSDVNDAITYLRNNSERFGLDQDRICVWALSAGSVLLSRFINENPPFIRCLVFYYAILDLEPLRKERPVITDDAIKEFSPLHVLSRTGKAFAPTFIARAGRDEPQLNVAVDRFIQEALSKKATIDFSNHAEGEHGFDVLNDNPRTREIIKRTLEFIKAHAQ